MLDAQVQQRRFQTNVEKGMNEYERKVNDAAINAHLKQDFNEVPYKLPGIKRFGQERQDKIIEKSYNRGNLLMNNVNQSVDYTRLRENSETESTLGNGMIRSSSVG